MTTTIEELISAARDLADIVEEWIGADVLDDEVPGVIEARALILRIGGVADVDIH